MTNIATAQREYFARPADERYQTLPDMLAAARADKQLSAERSYNWRDLRFAADAENVLLASPKGTATFSHWSFGQAARMLQAPAQFLREGLTPQLTADCLNHRIQQQPHGTSPVLLVRAANGRPAPQVRAMTSDSYARVWDADLYATIQDRFGDKWTAPPVWEGGTGGIYRGDRDSFAILCDGGSIVTDPTLQGRGDGTMYRALLIRNSEVGASSLQIETVLYRYICGNLMLWGAIIDRRFRRRHVGANAVRDTLRELWTIATQWRGRSASQDEAIIRGLIDREIASTREGVIDELRAIGYSEADAEAAYDACERTEASSPRSYWGIAQGTTRISQASGYQDERYALDKLAAEVLARGRRLVAA